MLTLALALAASATEAPIDDSDAWRAVLAERREANIARLEAYAEAGRYPLNLTQPGPAHLFMDDTGSRCGMAELIWLSGHEGLVVDTYTTRNDAVMAELDLGDPLTEWVAISGLTMDEVAFIQEPGFMVGLMEDPANLEPDPPIAVNPDLLELETQRRTAHFAMAAEQLRLTTEQSLDRAVLALGARVLSSPESLSWTSELSHRTSLTAPLPTPDSTASARSGWRSWLPLFRKRT